MAYKGALPAKDTIRKILILKIKNSSVYFNYPLEVFVFEGSNAGGMSWFLNDIIYQNNHIFVIYVSNKRFTNIISLKILGLLI